MCNCVDNLQTKNNRCYTSHPKHKSNSGVSNHYHVETALNRHYSVAVLHLFCSSKVAAASKAETAECRVERGGAAVCILQQDIGFLEQITRSKSTSLHLFKMKDMENHMITNYVKAASMTVY